jgi:nicotinamidase-related amidase
MEALNDKKSALFVIDFQKDFTSEKGFYSQRYLNRSKIKEAKVNLKNLFNTSIPAELFIVGSNYSKSQFGINLSICIPNTEGHKFDFDKNRKMKVYFKREHSLFSNMKLRTVLREEKFDRIILTGFLAEYCIYQSALDSINLGFETFIIPECIGTADEKYSNSIEKILKLGVKLLRQEDFKCE